MRLHLNKLFALLLLLTVSQTYAQDSVAIEDLKLIMGTWTGSLTYVDYSSNEPYTMPANLQVGPGKTEDELVLFYSYPNEPKANSKGKIKLSKDGRKLNKESVVSKETLADGSVQITTEYRGKDNNKEALIRGIYVLGKSVCVIRKEVKYDDSQTWLKRNEYSFSR